MFAMAISHEYGIEPWTLPIAFRERMRYLSCMSFQVILFYKYVTINEPHLFADKWRARAHELGLSGRFLVAEEGINATLEGEREKTECLIQELRQDERFADLKVKTSIGNGKSFPKLAVKVVREIVGTRFSQEDADPRVRTASRLSPEALHEMYAKNDDFVVVDMRNSYEFASGHFKNSIDPGMRASRDLQTAIVKLEPYKNKKIVTVCTGGIRCEKMSAYLLSKGFSDVCQLEEGIHAYMQKYPGQDFLGTLYTFDDRIMMDFGGDREIVGTCLHCKQKTERYLNCANDICHVHILVCEVCAPTADKAVCSRWCRLQASWLQLKKEIKILLEPARIYLKRKRRYLIKRSYRLIWELRLLKRKMMV